MSGVTEVVAVAIWGIGSLVKYGAYAVFKAGQLMVKGVAGLAVVTANGAKALADAIAEQHRKLAEEAERRRIEREKKREEDRLKALGEQKSVAEERINAIISDSNESAEKILQIISDAQSEVREVIKKYADIASAGDFDCTNAQSLLNELLEKIAAVQSRIERDNTVAELGRVSENIRNAEQSEQVREYLKSLQDNSALVAESQVALASARMDCAALKNAVQALTDLQRDISDISVELSVSNIDKLERIKILVRNTDVTDYDSIIQAYQQVNEFIRELKRNADVAQNLRLSAFLNARLAVIQDRLNKIKGEAVNQVEDDNGAEFHTLLEKAEDYYSVLSDGRLNYAKGIITEKMRAARINARAKSDLESLRKTVKFLASEVEIYESLCVEHDKYLALKAECDELAVALGYGEEYDNFSSDLTALSKEMARLEQLKQTYMAELAANRRSTLIARSALAFASEEYEFLGEYEYGDEEGTVELRYARKGEAGAIHVVQADLNGRVHTFTTGVNITDKGLSLSTAGTVPVKKACDKMRKEHLKNTAEFDEALGVDYKMEKVSDISPDDSAAKDLPCVYLEGAELQEYLDAVGAVTYVENGKLKLRDKKVGDTGHTVHSGDGVSSRTNTQGGEKHTSTLYADTNKK